MGVCCLCEAKMLLKILLLGLVLVLTDAKCSPQQDLEDLVEKLESRLRDVETRLMEELKDKVKEEKDELEKKGFEASTSKLRLEVAEEFLRKENTSNNALTIPSLRDLPIVIISAYQDGILTSPQTVTFDSFLANYNNEARPVLDLDSGVFTCFTPGYYTVSFSAYAQVAHVDRAQSLYLYKNKTELAESVWYFETANGDLDVNVAVTGSRIVILHLEEGDTLELRMTHGHYMGRITLNIELTGLGFDYHV